MSAKMEIIGNLGEPKSNMTTGGKQVLNLSVGHTPSRFNKETKAWEDTGDTLWVRAAFWEAEAEALVSQVRKGQRVRLEGEPMLSVREHEGKPYTNLELKFPKISFLPTKPVQSAAPQGGGWANPGQSFNESEAPF